MTTAQTFMAIEIGLVDLLADAAADLVSNGATDNAADDGAQQGAEHTAKRTSRQTDTRAGGGTLHSPCDAGGRACSRANTLTHLFSDTFGTDIQRMAMGTLDRHRQS